MHELTSRWSLQAGSHPVLAARLYVKSCDPHLHDTYTMAMMREGTAVVNVRTGAHVWGARTIFLVNPYDVHERRCGEDLVRYEVIYPSLELIRAGMGLSLQDQRLPFFTRPINYDPDVVDELGAVMSTFLDGRSANRGAAAEQDLIEFIRRRGSAIGIMLVDSCDFTPVRIACRIMQENLDSEVDLSELASQVGYSRFYFIRLFRKVTGVPPNVYLLQIRLSRARRLICSGYSLADAANSCGFADQSHMTRAFKRSFSTTPGKVARDLFPRVAGAA